MDEIRDFRKSADEAMCDINVTEEMMNEVLKKGTSGRRQTGMPLFRLAAAAACGVLILGIMRFAGILKPDDINRLQDDQPGIFSADMNRPESAGTDSSMLSEPGMQQWEPDSPGEAAESFGEGFLIPSYIPDGFRPAEIYASGTGKGNADSVIINYFSSDRSFQITEQRSAQAPEFTGFEKIDINGAVGYIDSQDQYTQLHWFSQGVQYSISGALIRDEAIRTARSMEAVGKNY
jgi:hypothetical protein